MLMLGTSSSRICTKWSFCASLLRRWDTLGTAALLLKLFLLKKLLIEVTGLLMMWSMFIGLPTWCWFTTIFISFPENAFFDSCVWKDLGILDYLLLSIWLDWNWRIFFSLLVIGLCGFFMSFVPTAEIMWFWTFLSPWEIPPLMLGFFARIF